MCLNDSLVCDALACKTALNYQTAGLETLINHCKFDENGRSGYVLKPAYLLPSAGGQLPVFDPLHVPDAPPFAHRVLHVEIVSGRRLPKPEERVTGEVVDPYVEVLSYLSTDRVCMCMCVCVFFCSL